MIVLFLLTIYEFDNGAYIMIKYTYNKFGKEVI